MGISPIPVTRIVQYAMLEKVVDIRMFKNIMLKVDNAYMKYVSDEQQKKSKVKG